MFRLLSIKQACNGCKNPENQHRIKKNVAVWKQRNKPDVNRAITIHSIANAIITRDKVRELLKEEQFKSNSYSAQQEEEENHLDTEKSDDNRTSEGLFTDLFYPNCVSTSSKTSRHSSSSNNSHSYTLCTSSLQTKSPEMTSVSKCSETGEHNPIQCQLQIKLQPNITFYPT